VALASVTVRLEAQLVAELDAAAAALGLTRTEWLKRAVEERLRAPAERPPARTTGPVEAAAYAIRQITTRSSARSGGPDGHRCGVCGALTLVGKGGRFCKACRKLVDGVREPRAAYAVVRPV